jgi:large subunit ribosomal protein L10
LEQTKKRTVVADLKARFEGAAAVYVTDYRGSTAGEMMSLRRKLAAADAQYLVVKNTLARLAVEGTGVACLADDFTGPTAIAIATTDPAAPAKVLKQEIGSLPNVTLRCGMVESRRVEMAEIHALADLPSKEELLAKLLAVINAPASQLARMLNAPGAQVVRLLDAVGKTKA